MLSFQYPPLPDPLGALPPGPVDQLLALFLGLALLAILIPQPWRKKILEGVWPFPQVDKWLREQMR